jgi:putative ABC transport system ATP-binding protein
MNQPEAKPQPAAPIVRVTDLHKTYRTGEVDVPAVCGVNLSIRRGEFVAIMGPSGSGKSTFMNLVGCLDRPDKGEYWLDDRNVATLSRGELADVRNVKIGFVFQSFNLLSRTTIVDNVALPLMYQRIGARERRKRASLMLDGLGLGNRLRHHTNQLSGGQQQRVAIARALVTRPVILLADEPTGNLDTRTGEDIMALLQGLNRRSGLTILLVTHEQDIAAFADRHVHFRDGKIERDDRNATIRNAADMPGYHLEVLPVVMPKEKASA